MHRWPVCLLLAASSWGCGSSSPESRDAAVARDASQLDGASDADAPLDDAGDHHDAAKDDAGDGHAPSVYALKTVIEVSWQDDVDPPLHDPGSGTITLFHRLDAATACGDSELQLADLEPCGFELPEFTAELYCAAYRLEAGDQSGATGDAGAGVELELSKLGEQQREMGCSIGAAIPFVYRGIPVGHNYNAICDPFDAEQCAQAISLSVSVDPELAIERANDPCAPDAGTEGLLEVSGFGITVHGCERSDDVACTDEEREFVADFLPPYTVEAVRSALVELDPQGAVDCAGVRRAVASELSP